MQATTDDLNRLLDAQRLDCEIRQLEKQLHELPQPQVILDARAKKAALKKKAAQVEELGKDVGRRLARINDEDESLAKKEAGVQAAIESAQGDYRNVEVRSKELAGISRRREALAENKEDILAEQAKIDALEVQIRSAFVDVDAMETKATQDYQKQGGDLKTRISSLESQRDALFMMIDGALVERYRKTAEKLGSIALGELVGDRCGVCRSVIEGGRIIDLRKEAPLGVCPSCNRLLIIRD